MNDHLHECPHPDCRRNIPLAFYACGPHWKQLPSNIRSYISRAWAGVKHGVAGALHEHDRAAEKAMAYWKDQAA